MKAAHRTGLRVGCRTQGHLRGGGKKFNTSRRRCRESSTSGAPVHLHALLPTTCHGGPGGQCSEYIGRGGQEEPRALWSSRLGHRSCFTPASAGR